MASNFERTVYTIELRDKFSMGMNRATATTNRFNRGMVTARTNTTLFSSALRGLAVGALAGVAYGLGRVTSQIVKMAAELETTTVAFEVMLRSASKAQSLVAYGMEFARTTPFTQRQVFGNMRQLLAYGAPEQNIRGYNKMLSTIAAGVGMERLPFLTLALGQVIAKGRLQGQELRQFTEHGVPVVGMLSQQMGISTQDVYEQMRKGMISSQMVVDAMMAMTTEGGLFQGMLERLRETFTGTFNVMKSTWQLYAIEAVEPLKKKLKALFDGMIELAEEMPRLDGAFASLKMEAKSMVTPFQELARVFKELTGLGFIDLLVGGFKVLVTGLTVLWNGIKTTFMAGLSVVTLIIDTALSLYRSLASKFPGMPQIPSWVPEEGITAWMWKTQGLGNQRKLRTIWDYDPSDPNSEFYRGFKGTPYTRPGVRKLQWWEQLGMYGKKQYEPFSLLDPNKMVDLWSGGKGGGEDDDDPIGNKKRVANRLIGTGARDIVIHIGNLIENMSIATPSIGESADQLTERVKVAMLTAINDASILADR